MRNEQTKYRIFRLVDASFHQLYCLQFLLKSIDNSKSYARKNKFVLFSELSVHTVPTTLKSFIWEVTALRPGKSRNVTDFDSILNRLLTLNGENISNWPPWHIRHCTLAIHLICPNRYNIMNPHGLCDLPLLLNSLFHDTTLNLARVHFESQHQKSWTYCLLVSVILHHSLHFVGI